MTEETPNPFPGEEPVSPAQAKADGLLYPCRPGVQDQVVALFDVMEPRERLLAFEWAIPLDVFPQVAYQEVRELRSCEEEHRGEDRDRAIGNLREMQSWLDVVESREAVPVLEYDESSDGVGEDMEHLVWGMMSGGGSNQLVAEQAQYLKKYVDSCVRYISGEARMLMLPMSVVEHMPTETRAARAEREAGEAAEIALEVARMLATATTQLRGMLSGVGVSLEELLAEDAPSRP